MKTIGERHWTAGPILIAPKRLHEQLVKSFTVVEAKPLKALKKAAGIAKVGTTSVVFLGANEETCCKPWGPDAVVLVHCKETEGCLLAADRAKALAALEPRDLPDKAWKLVGTVALDGTSVMFDVGAKDPVGAKAERKRSLAIPLPKGTFVVEMATGKAMVKPYPNKLVPVAYRHVRIRPKAWTPAPRTGAPTPPPTDDGPVLASPEVIAAAKTLVWASNDQIPFVIAPRKHLAAWQGGGIDDDIPSPDYDRACAVNGVATIALGGGEALVQSEPGGLAFWPTSTGGLLVTWLGADSAAGCIAAALSIPAKLWKREKAMLAVKKGAEELVIFDSFARGDSLTAKGLIGDDGSRTASFRLKPGRYAIDSVWSYEAEVKVGKRVEDTMIAVLRLQPR